MMDCLYVVQTHLVARFAFFKFTETVKEYIDHLMSLDFYTLLTRFVKIPPLLLYSSKAMCH